MSLLEDFPNPGPQPSKLGPTPSIQDTTAWVDWNKQKHDYNNWIRAMRKHTVARAVTEITTKEESKEPLRPYETIAGILGRAYLEGEFDPFNMFSGF